MGDNRERQGQEGSQDERSRGESGDSGGSGGSGNSGDSGSSTSAWEWAVAALGALLVLAAVGFMILESATSEGTPPALEVAVDSVARAGAHYVAHVTVSNTGGMTAAGLELEGELKADRGSVEKSGVTIDYIPSKGKRRAGLIFTRDPAAYELSVRPTGYDLP